MHYSLIAKMRLAFIDSDLLYIDVPFYGRFDCAYVTYLINWFLIEYPLQYGCRNNILPDHFSIKNSKTDMFI